MDDNSNKITLKDPEAMLDWAFRYTVTRQSYAVRGVVDEILHNWDNLHEVSKRRYINEIKSISNHDPLWNKILEKESSLKDEY